MITIHEFVILDYLNVFQTSLTKSMKLSMTGQFGTPLYLPPEILRGDDSYDQSVDVYAFSMIAYEIVSGEEPFSELGQNISPFALIQKIINGYRPKFNKGITKKMQELISKCWSDNPKERPTFSEIFDCLTNDMSYFLETIDENEINEYIDMINEANNTRTKKIIQNNSENQQFEEEKNNLNKKIKKLKSKLKHSKEDKNNLKQEVDQLKSELKQSEEDKNKLKRR